MKQVKLIWIDAAHLKDFMVKFPESRAVAWPYGNEKNVYGFYVYEEEEK